MKKICIILVLLYFSCFQAWSQGNSPRIGEEAPSFTGQSTTGKIHFPGDYTGKWKILFSHPADFTPVCSSEILELSALQDDFNKLDVKLIVLSTDALEKHNEWTKSIETIKYKDRVPQSIKFPLISDEDRVISKKYGMMTSGSNSTKDVRGVFIIDPENKIRAMFFYPMEIGRNMEEIKRTVLALQTADKDHILTPANWQPGNDVLLKASNNDPATGKPVDPDVYQLIWYMTFKKM